MFNALFSFVALLTSCFCVGSIPVEPPRDCGIVEGTNRVAVAEFPWMALLIYKSDDSFPCAGTLINERFVLTTAQCAEKDDLIRVRLGTRTRNRYCDKYTNVCSQPPLQDFRIKSIFVHDEYNKTTLVNDIALIKLARNVNADGYITPICLPLWNQKSAYLHDEYALSTGWGPKEYGTNLTHQVVQSPVTIKSLDCCRRTYDNPLFEMKQLCAGGRGGITTCNGGNGGPLMFSTEKCSGLQFVQYGITSYGECVRRNQPRVYTSVRFYVQWILKIIEF